MRSKDGVVVLDDSVTHKTGDEIPNAGWFYDHAENDIVWGQNLVFSQYADDKTTYLLGFRLYEKEADSKIDHAKALVDEAHEVSVPADTYLFDSWYCSQELVEHVESYGKDWISVLKSDRQVEYGGEMIRVDALGVVCVRNECWPRSEPANSLPSFDFSPPRSRHIPLPQGVIERLAWFSALVREVRYRCF